VKWRDGVWSVSVPSPQNGLDIGSRYNDEVASEFAHVSRSLGLYLNTLLTLCQASESRKSSKSKTYEGNHAADEFRDPVQTISSYDFFVGEFGTEREVSESQEVDVFVIGVVSLNET
jgi:hypothetical protein